MIRCQVCRSWSVNLILKYGSPWYSPWIEGNLYRSKKIRACIAFYVSVQFLQTRRLFSFFPSIKMPSSFPVSPKVLIFPSLLLVFWRFWKNISITPALPQSQQTTFWLLSFQYCVYPFTSTEYTTLWNTLKTLTISPLETPPPPPNTLIYGSTFTIFIHRTTVLVFILLPSHSV